MTRHTFGWSLPPGVTDRMIDEAAGGHDEDHRTDDAEEGYRDGWQHGYESALNDVRQIFLAQQRTVQAYGMDCEVVQIDEALDAISALAKAKP